MLTSEISSEVIADLLFAAANDVFTSMLGADLIRREGACDLSQQHWFDGVLAFDKSTSPKVLPRTHVAIVHRTSRAHP